MTTNQNPSNESAVEAVIGGVTSIFTLGAKIFSHTRQRSLADFTAVAHNRVIALVSDQITHHEVTTDILKFSLNVYAGYILQSVALLNEVGNVKVREVLSQVNTNRLSDDALIDLIGTTKISKEGLGVYSVESPMDYPRYYSSLVRTPHTTSVESYGLFKPGKEDFTVTYDGLSKDPASDLAVGEKARGQTVSGSHTTSDANLRELASDGSSLAQGKILNVQINNNGQSTTFPVVVALSPIICNRAMLTSIYSGKSVRNGFLSRLRRLKSGELDAVRDGIMVDDIIKAKAKAKKDANAYLNEIDKRQQRNNLASALSGRLSLATASGIAVITTDNARAIELEIQAKIESPAGREKVFNVGALVMLAIVDTDYNIVRIYHRGHTLGIDMTFSQIKSASRGDGPNIMEILLAFSQGKTPTF